MVYFYPTPTELLWHYLPSKKNCLIILCKWFSSKRRCTSKRNKPVELLYLLDREEKMDQGEITSNVAADEKKDESTAQSKTIIFVKYYCLFHGVFKNHRVKVFFHCSVDFATIYCRAIFCAPLLQCIQIRDRHSLLFDAIVHYFFSSLQIQVVLSFFTDEQHNDTAKPNEEKKELPPPEQNKSSEPDMPPPMVGPRPGKILNIGYFKSFSAEYILNTCFFLIGTENASSI